MMRYLVLFLACVATAGAQQSARTTGPVEQYNITSYPIYGRALNPSDSDIFAIPGFVRANADGTIKVDCQGNPGQPITLTVVTGEFVPCRVVRVYATTTTVTSMHLFY